MLSSATSESPAPSEVEDDALSSDTPSPADLSRPRRRRSDVGRSKNLQSLMAPVHGVSERQSLTERPELAEPLRIIRVHKWSIVGFAIALGLLAFLATSQQTPQYQSRALVLLKRAIGPNGNPVGLNLVTEESLAASPKVAQEVADDLNMPGKTGELLSGLTVNDVQDSEILEITYIHPDPKQARLRAQTFAEAYLTVKSEGLVNDKRQAAEGAQREIDVLNGLLKELQDRIVVSQEPTRSSLQLEANLLAGLIVQRQLEQVAVQSAPAVGEILHPASQPDKPISPSHGMNTAFGVIVGAVLGAAAPLVRDRLSGKLRSSREIEAILGGPVLGIIPEIPKRKWREGAFLVTTADEGSSVAEAFRILRTNILSSIPPTTKTLLVTSPHQGDGKTATVANLGVSLARAGRRVILVSADLRRPRLPAYLRVRKEAGVTEILKGRLSVEDGLCPTRVANLRLLCSGAPADSPAEILGSNTMKDLLRTLSNDADHVLIDAPPLLAVSDAMVLARLADSVLLVVGPKSMTELALETTREHLENLGANLSGIILNNVDPPFVRSFTYS